tara:strand:+ start:216 stop:389 length:174 start_codon:yes stop_codon:yes gene_type:complete
MTAQIITKREFWNAMVAKAVQKFEYGISTGDQLVADLVRLGWSEDEATSIVFEDAEV